MESIRFFFCFFFHYSEKKPTLPFKMLGAEHERAWCHSIVMTKKQTCHLPLKADIIDQTIIVVAVNYHYLPFYVFLL